MDRGFFLADNDWTCYRRNYFQVSGAFAIHGLNHYYADQETQCLVQVDGHFFPVHNFSMNISARVSNSDKKIELVQHTPKRDKGPQSTPIAKLIMPGGNLSMSSVGANQSIVTFERIQFKTATANNGKRRAAQQYYEIVVDLYANCNKGESVRVATCTSAALVVRGRSPGHYADSHTRFKHADNESSISNESTATIDQQQQQTSPNNRYSASLPNSPISEFGPYSPYNGYPYSSISAYSPMMPPNSSNLSPYASHPLPSQGQVPGPYFQPVSKLFQSP